MDKKKIIMKKEKFIDEVFGEEIEYTKIHTEQGIIIVFGLGEKIIIKYFENVKQLTEKYIEQYIENDFLSEMLGEQDIELENLTEDNSLTRFMKAISSQMGDDENSNTDE